MVKGDIKMTYEYHWDIDPKDPENVVIYHYGKRIMGIYMGEAIQSMGRNRTMEIVRELDSCEYIKPWQKEKYEEVVDILKK
jgi:hypothetical protein